MNTNAPDLKSNRCRVLANMIDNWHNELAQARRASREARNAETRARGEISRLERRIARLEAILAAAAAAGRAAPHGLPKLGPASSSAAARADLALAKARLLEADKELSEATGTRAGRKNMKRISKATSMAR